MLDFQLKAEFTKDLEDYLSKVKERLQFQIEVYHQFLLAVYAFLSNR